MSISPALLQTVIINSSSSFLPTDISGLVLWLDANDISTLFQDDGLATPVTADADTVGGWTDKSGAGNDIIQATSANRPTYKTGIQNGLPVVRLDGTNDSLDGLFAAATTQPLTIFAVAAMVAGDVNDGGDHFLFDGENATNRIIFGQNSITTPDDFTVYAGSWLATGEASSSNWLVWTGLINAASSEMWHNGVSIGAGDPGAKILDGITVGSSHAQNASFWEGDIAELLIYDAALSATDRQTVETYINNKWAVY